MGLGVPQRAHFSAHTQAPASLGGCGGGGERQDGGEENPQVMNRLKSLCRALPAVPCPQCHTYHTKRQLRGQLRGWGECGNHGTEPQETRHSPPPTSTGTAHAADFDRLPPCPDTVLHEHTWVVEILIASDLEHKFPILLRVQLGTYFFTKEKKLHENVFAHDSAHM